jgi:hypothetical protein
VLTSPGVLISSTIAFILSIALGVALAWYWKKNRSEGKVDIHQGGMLSMQKRCFFSKILNFYSTFFNVKKNSIFDLNSRVEEKHCIFKKHRFY